MSAKAQQPADLLVAKAADRTALIGVVGLGYVGLPLALEFVRAGYRVVGFDVNQATIAGLNQGRSHIQDVPTQRLAEAVRARTFAATSDLSRLNDPDVISICVHTP